MMTMTMIMVMLLLVSATIYSHVLNLLFLKN